MRLLKPPLVSLPSQNLGLGRGWNRLSEPKEILRVVFVFDADQRAEIAPVIRSLPIGQRRVDVVDVCPFRSREDWGRLRLQPVIRRRDDGTRSAVWPRHTCLD